MTKKGLLVFAAFTIPTIAGVAGLFVYRPSKPEAVVQTQQVATSPLEANNADIIGTLRPEFSLADVSGQIRSIGEWDGKVLAINFWATWCPPCIKEIPEFIKIQRKYQRQGLQFIGIALQRPEEVTEFMQTYGMNYPVLTGEMEVVKIAESYGNEFGALPYTVIVDRQGRIQYVKLGPVAGDTVDSVIAKLL